MYGSTPLLYGCHKDKIICPIKDIALPSVVLLELNTAKIEHFLKLSK